MSLFASDALAADTATTTAATAVAPEISTNTMMIDNLMLLASLFFIFYFMLILPQKKRIKAQKELMKSLTKGQKVMTTGGLLGVISKLESDHVVVLEVAQGVKVRVARDAVSQVVTADSASSESANDN